MDFQLAWRNIWRNPRRTVIIMMAVVIGVWTMIAMTALIRGMLADIFENGISTLTGDVKIYPRHYHDDPSVEFRIRDVNPVLERVARKMPPGAKYAARVRVNAVAANARHSVGVTLVGIDPAGEKGVSFIGDGVAEGRMPGAGEKNTIVVGRALLDEMETRIGHKLILMSQDAENEIASKSFTIVGVFKARLESTEKAYVFVSRPAVQKMLKIGSDVSEISLVLKDHEGFEEAAGMLRAEFADLQLEVYTWKDLLPMLKAYMEISNGFIMLWFLVVFVAMAFGIINTMLMAVFERMREFGLLKALGMKPMRILRSVLMESAIILVMGAAAGNALAIGSVLLAAAKGIDLSALATGFEYAGMSAVIYPAIAFKDLLTANAVVVVLGLLVSMYPAMKAARITPVKAMMYR